MNRMTAFLRSILPLCLLVFSVHANAQPGQAKPLLEQIRAEFSRHTGTFAVAFMDAQTGEQILFHERETFHAASTMKTPVMIEVFRQVAEGSLRLTDSMVIRNQFASIVDGSPYALRPEDDSEQDLYKRIGQKLPIYEVMYRMIILSSNLGTNLIIDKVGARNVTNTLRNLGARDIHVLRGVEDSKAFAKGLNNTVTGYDLVILFDQMARGKMIDGPSCDKMIAILKDQRFNEIIPAQLPAGVVVAHKTGSIRGVQHDSGIVMMPDGRRYSLVLLSKGLTDEPAAVQSMARVSRMIYDYVNRAR